MKERRRIWLAVGLTLLTLLYLALCYLVLRYNGFTLYNLLVCGIAGAIIFIPIKKKYD